MTEQEPRTDRDDLSEPLREQAGALAELLRSVAEQWRARLEDLADDDRTGRVEPVILPHVDRLERAADLLAAAPGEPAEVVRRRLEDDNARLLHDAELALRLRDDFLAIASHELRTPLTPLQLQLDNLMHIFREREGSDGPTVRQLARARRQVTRLVEIVDTLLDVSRMSSGQLPLEVTSFDMVELVHHAARRHRPAALHVGSSIIVHAPEPLRGRWDRLRIEQMLANLLSNAVKYGKGRPITVRVEGSEDTIRISVQDEGIGISEEHANRIFERFERASSHYSYGGFGLGLYVSRRIAQAHGGTIVVSSRPSEGATFTVVLPRDTLRAQPQPSG